MSSWGASSASSSTMGRPALLPYEPRAPSRRSSGSTRGPCSSTFARSTTTTRVAPSSRRTSTTWPTRSSSRWFGGGPEGGRGDGTGRQDDAAETGDRRGGRFGHLCPRSRDDLPVVPGAARRHPSPHNGSRRRRGERDHDEQRHDPGGGSGVLPYDVARTPPLGVGGSRGRTAPDRPDRKDGGGPAGRGRRRRALHGLGRGDGGRDGEDPLGGGPGMRDPGHALHRGGRIPLTFASVLDLEQPYGFEYR